MKSRPGLGRKDLKMNQKTSDLLQVVIFLLLLAGVIEMYQQEMIFAGEEWRQQPCPVTNEAGAWSTRYQNTCSPVLHPSPLAFVLFEGAVVALGIHLFLSVRPSVDIHINLKKVLVSQWKQIQKAWRRDVPHLVASLGVGLVIVVPTYIFIQWIKFEERVWEVKAGYNNEVPLSRVYEDAPGFTQLYQRLGFEPGHLWASMHSNDYIVGGLCLFLVCCSFVFTIRGTWRFATQ